MRNINKCHAEGISFSPFIMVDPAPSKRYQRYFTVMRSDRTELLYGFIQKKIPFPFSLEPFDISSATNTIRGIKL